MHHEALPAATLLIWLAGASPVRPAEPPAFVETTPASTRDVLFNPGMGLYLQYPPLDSKPEEWHMAICDIAYYRLDWSAVHPGPGEYAFEESFGPMLDFWVKQRGKRFAFRVMSQNMHSPAAHVTPKWVFDQGVPGVTHTGLNGKPQTDPVFWDDRYLDLQCEFVSRLGAYFSDKEGIEFVDIGGIGEWGEMHLARWTPRQLAETGFSEFRYARAYRRLIDAYAAAFPRTRVFLNVGGRNHQSINDYAALRGAHFRQDGLTPSGASYDCGEWLYKPYSRRGVVCNFEFHSGYEEMLRKNWDVKGTIERGLAAPISYLNTNLFGGGSVRKAPEEARALLTDAARRVGYRFVLPLLRHPAEIKAGPGRRARLPLEAVWRNDGVAPCHGSYAIRWSLTDAAGKEVAREETFPAVPTTHWWPGESVAEKAVLRAPEGLAAGACRLHVAMFDPGTGKTIALGIAGKGSAGGYDLAPITVVPATPGDADVRTFEFETGAKPWHASPGLQSRVEAEGGHESPGCLLVSGATTTSWNYASARVGPVAPYALYRLSAWVKVEELSEPRKAPYLKLGINDAGGKWLANAATEPYDATRLGTWQLLEGTAEMPPDAGSADIAVEKGDSSTPVAVTLRLDGVRLELVEAP